MTADFSYGSVAPEAIFDGHPGTEMVKSEQLFALV